MKSRLLAVGWGTLGMLLALAGWHAYTDHQTWHALLNTLTSQRTAPQPSKD